VLLLEVSIHGEFENYKKVFTAFRYSPFWGISKDFIYIVFVFSELVHFLVLSVTALPNDLHQSIVCYALPQDQLQVE